MPTFNQLVRKGRQQSTDKSKSPAMQYGLNTLKNKETDLPCQGPARRPLPHHPRYAGHPGRPRPYAGPLQVRRKAPEVQVTWSKRSFARPG